MGQEIAPDPEFEAKLDYVERQAEANMADHCESASGIRSEANVALGFFLGGAGAAFGLAITTFSHDVPLAVSSLCASVYLFLLSAALVGQVLQMTDFPNRFNDATNLLGALESRTLAELRQDELKNLQARIEQAIAINTARSNHLNRLRMFAACSPCVAFLGWLMAVAV